MPKKGYKMTEEHKQKLRGPRPSLQGENHPMWGIKGTNNPRFGMKHTKKTKKRISKKHKGMKLSEETKRKISQTQKRKIKEMGHGYNLIGGPTAENHPNWKGGCDTFIHRWARENVPRPRKCQICNKKPPALTHNISGTYKRNINDWEWLCYSCHCKTHKVNVKHGRFCK